MFQLQPKYVTFEYPVSIPVAGHEPTTLRIVYKAMTLKQYREVSEWARDTNASTISFCEKIIDGWKDCDTEYNHESLRTLLDNYPAAGGALINQYSDALLQGLRGN